MKYAMLINAIGECWVCLFQYTSQEIAQYRAKGFSIIMRERA